MSNPDLVCDMIRAVKAILQDGKSMSIKIRIHKDLDETIEFVRKVKAAGVDFITVHARTRSQRSSTPPDFEALKILKRKLPDLLMLANGDVYTTKDARRIVDVTGVEGVMAARGILENPCLFAGYEHTPIEAVTKFMHYATCTGLRFELIVHHIGEMLCKIVSKKQRKGLMYCRDIIDLIDWLEDGKYISRP